AEGRRQARSYPRSFFETAALTARPSQDEVRGFAFDRATRAMRLISWDRSVDALRNFCPVSVELKCRARAGGDLNAREFAERNSEIMQDCGPYGLRMGNDGDALARTGCHEAREAGERSALEFAHGLSSRRTAALAVAIPALPMAIILQRIECAAGPGAEIRLVEFRHHLCR